MKNWKLIGRIATFSAVAAAVITVIVGIISYLTVGLVYSGAPADFYALQTLTAIMPYLLVTVILLIVAVMARGAEIPEETPETPEDEALPPAQPAEANA
jgi:H+/Cl- antiporter ClcA